MLTAPTGTDEARPEALGSGRADGDEQKSQCMRPKDEEPGRFGSVTPDNLVLFGQSVV